MSIYVSITRRAEPLADDGPSITSDEWLVVIAEQADFRLPQGDESEWAGPFARVWSRHSDYAVVFDWADGQIDVKNPDEPTVAMMKKLATYLSANVISETGEIFTDSGESGGFLPGYP
jgi:hypothetical protein